MLRGQPFAWVLRGVYIGLPPRGYNGNPTGCWSQPSVSTLAGFSAGCGVPPAAGSRRLRGPAGWWVPPAAGYLVDRPAPPPRVLSAAAHCSLASDDEGFVEASVATVGRLGGSHCSLTSSCLLNGAPASRKGVAGFCGPATPLADWERPGRLHAPLWLKGPAARGPYGSLSWMTLRLAWLQCRAARETAVPYGLL